MLAAVQDLGSSVAEESHRQCNTSFSGPPPPPAPPRWCAHAGFTGPMRSQNRLFGGVFNIKKDDILLQATPESGSTRDKVMAAVRPALALKPCNSVFPQVSLEHLELPLLHWRPGRCLQTSKSVCELFKSASGFATTLHLPGSVWSLGPSLFWGDLCH